MAAAQVRSLNGVRPDWFPDWDGECAAIVAAGPSVTQAQVDLLRDRIHVIAINTSFELCLWADALYACDLNWWKLKKGAPDFKGLKIAQDPEAIKCFPDLKRLEIRKVKGTSHTICHDLLMDRYGEIGGGGNSGFQVINWLVQCGVTAIALLGFDFRDFDGKVHWHGRHPDSGPFVLNNPALSNFRLWTETMNKAAPRLRSLGIDVVNCSAQSALECFPKVSVEQAFARWGL